jgi:hypothetical protein
LTGTVYVGDQIAVPIGLSLSNTCPSGWITSVTDSLGNSFAPYATQQASLTSTSCGFTAVYTSTATIGGASDTITVHVTTSPAYGRIQAYEASGVASPSASASNSCTSCGSTTLTTSTSITYSANSFMVTTGATGGSQTISSGPAGFTGTTGNREYCGYEIPASGTSSTFSMTASGNPNAFAILVVYFAPG